MVDLWHDIMHPGSKSFKPTQSISGKLRQAAGLKSRVNYVRIGLRLKPKAQT